MTAEEARGWAGLVRRALRRRGWTSGIPKREMAPSDNNFKNVWQVMDLKRDYVFDANT